MPKRLVVELEFDLSLGPAITSSTSFLLMFASGRSKAIRNSFDQKFILERI